MTGTAVFALALVLASAQAGDEGRYVVPPPGSADEHAPLRALATSDDKPAGVKVEVKPLGRMRFAQVAFGSPGSLPITLAVDDMGRTAAHLYVDAERVGRITTACKVSGDSGVWRVRLDAIAIQGKDKDLLPRTLLVKYQRFTRTLAVATCGHIEGTVRLGDKKVRYRRVDGDANGLFANRDDQLWLDLDGDGKFSPRTERFLWQPVLLIVAARLQVHGDPIGKHLTLEALIGEGTFRVRFADAKFAKTLKEASVNVVDRHGSVYPLDPRGDTRLPVGVHRFHSVDATWQHDGGAWRFIFVDPLDESQTTTIDLRKDAVVTSDPLAGLHVTLTVKKENDSLRIEPAIRTRAGLYLYRCALGGNWEQARAAISVRDGSGQEIGMTGCGFT